MTLADAEKRVDAIRAIVSDPEVAHCRGNQVNTIPTPAQFRAARGALGMTMAQVSRKFPITTQAIWKAEQNVRLHISDMMLLRLQRAYESLGVAFYRDEETVAIWLPTSQT